MGSKKLKKIQNEQEDLQQLVTRKRKKKGGQNVLELTTKDMNQSSETNQKSTRRKQKTKQVNTESIESQELEPMKPTEDIVINNQSKGIEKKTRKKLKQLQNTLVQENTVSGPESHVENNIELREVTIIDDQSKLPVKKSRKKNVELLEEDTTDNQVKVIEKKLRKKQKLQSSVEHQSIDLESLESNTEHPVDIVSDNSSSNVPEKKLKKKHKHLQIEQGCSTDSDTVLENNEIDIEAQPRKEKTEIVWPAEDLAELIKNMESCIPEGDHLSFKSRIGKLDWKKISFKEYSVTECQTVWGQLEKKIRGYRLLLEVLEDAKKVVQSPQMAQERHPEMPKLPPSAYFLFCLKKKTKIATENPELESSELSKFVMQTYKSLPPEKREKYEKQAAKQKEEYKQSLEQFFLNHPEVERTEKQKKAREKEKIPKKPETPFHLFYLSKLKEQNTPDTEKMEFKEKCREEWKEMSDENKLIWINAAEQKFKIYENCLKEYMTEHPDYVPQKNFKQYLTRDDVVIKNRLAGKPQKPPTSVYALYTSLRLQSEEVKQILPTKERLPFVSGEWKNLPDDEKQKYRDMWSNMRNEYKKKYEVYLSTLSQDQRQLEMESNVPRKKRKADGAGSSEKLDNKRAKPNEKISVEPAEEIPQHVPPKSSTTTSPRKNKKKGEIRIIRPKKPQTPLGLFCLSELQKCEVPVNKKHDFKLSCKEKWKQLPDKKKIVFITEAQEKYKEYEKTYKKFISENPQFAREKFKRPVLSKSDVYIIERVAGKPRKPSGSVYGLYSSITLQTEALKCIPPRERLPLTSTMWKELPDEEKKRFRELWICRMEQYKKDFKAYLSNLPEDKKQQELKNTMQSKRKKAARSRARKAKAARVEKPVVSTRSKAEKLTEPEQPPISVYSYFTKNYSGDRPASEAWKSLLPEEKKRYQQELVQKKQEYIKEFERFLRSLTKEQLEEFSKQRMKSGSQKNEENDDEEDEEDDDENSEEDESEDEDDEDD